ncbi:MULTISPECIES: hypothetical protein [Corallococcus]|uniref:hypothetical protein n=1 Tax=Corallococcus TaxID=83461 RepID=UPI00142F0EDB|nr:MULTISPECIES: hypothetical protein [Corallococcus]
MLPPPLQKTSPKTWSRHGWQDLRWGMGPGDVADALEGRYSSSYVMPPLGNRKDPSHHVVLAETIFGFQVRAGFYFDGGRLDQLSLGQIVEGKDPSGLEGVLWFGSLKPALEAKYGKPSCLPTTDENPQCDWDRKDGRISLSVRSGKGWVTYFAPISAEKLKQMEMERQQKKREYVREMNKL